MVAEDAMHTFGTVAVAVYLHAENLLVTGFAENLYQIALLIHVCLIPFFTDAVAEIEVDGIDEEILAITACLD